MTNLEKYNNAFKESLGLNEGDITNVLKYQSVAEWDSVGHMELISELEDAFDIAMETDDIIDFNSYEAGVKILGKYGVEI